MIISVFAVTVLWIAVLAQFPSHRNAPLRRAVWYTIALLAAIGTLDLPAIGARLDTATGLPNAADVAQHVLAITAATLGRYCAEQVIGGPRRRTRLSGWAQAVLPAATVAAMLVLFALSPARTHPTDTARYTDFPMQYAAHPAAFAYWLIFAVYLGTAFTLIAQLAWRCGRRAGRTPLGCGLVLIAAGMVAGLGYVGYSTAVVAARAAGAQGAFVGTAPGIIQGLSSGGWGGGSGWGGGGPRAPPRPGTARCCGGWRSTGRCGGCIRCGPGCARRYRASRWTRSRSGPTASTHATCRCGCTAG